jgi:hypothetical protein
MDLRKSKGGRRRRGWAIYSQVFLGDGLGFEARGEAGSTTREVPVRERETSKRRRMTSGAGMSAGKRI